MSFRRRTVILAAGAVSMAVVLASVVVYIVTREQLNAQIDASLRRKLTPGQAQSVQIRTGARASELASLQKASGLPRAAAIGMAGSASVPTTAKAQVKRRVSPVPGSKRLARETVSITRTIPAGKQGKVPPGAPVDVSAGANAKLVLPPPELGGATGYIQLFQSDGTIVRSANSGSALPITGAARAVAAGSRDAFFSNVTVAGTPMRMLTERAPPHGVWQVVLPLADMNRTLWQLKLILAGVILGGIALAAALGMVVSRAAVVPVRRLTHAAERVARTQDLGHRIRDGEKDELGQLARSFNTMLAALERARLAQRQLISDASHELRTPLTSVRANLDALALGDGLSRRERARIVAAAQAQLGELTVLVGDLVDLSKSEVDEIEVEDVRLDRAAAASVERARLHAPGCRFALVSDPCLVRASPARLERAIANLLDNAVKWGPSDGPVEVSVRDGTLEVRDHGPGIAAEDLPRVFDRFYRAPAARGRPGSGLGLAIVRQAAEAHDGSVHASNHPEGGAVLTLELPHVAMTDADVAAVTPARSPAVHRVPRVV